MKTTFSIMPYLKHELRANKPLISITLRITVNGQRTEISTKRRIDPERWDQQAHRVKGVKEDAREINAHIDFLILKINQIHHKIEDEGSIVTVHRIKEIFEGRDEKRKTLLDVFSAHNEQMKIRVGIDFSKSTMTRYNTTYDHVVKFIKANYRRDNFFLHEIEYSFITKFEHFLKVVHGCNHNSTQKYIRNFRKIINEAVKNNWLDKDPFKAYRVKLVDVKRIFLNKEELAALEDGQFENNRLEQVRDVFVFCCYTGLSYVDVEKLSPNEIVKGLDGEYWINIDRTKTGTASNIPLLPKALALLKKYSDQVKYENKLLPVISNQRINAYLKEVANICNIKKKLTFHAARHTFATTITLTNGIPIETVSSMLGHKNFRTTQIYAKVVQEKISVDMKMLREKLNAATLN